MDIILGGGHSEVIHWGIYILAIEGAMNKLKGFFEDNIGDIDLPKQWGLIFLMFVNQQLEIILRDL